MSKLELTIAPVIEYGVLKEIGENVQKRINDLAVDKLVVTEDTVKDIKKLRTELKKEFADYEVSRKSIKEAVSKPYTEFENEYKIQISNKYKEADDVLSKSITEVEDGIKSRIEEELKSYFNQNNNHKFIVFENLDIKINLSTSMKKYKENIDLYLSKIEDDLQLISTQENKERILVEYRKTLNVSQAINTVKRDIETERQLLEASKIEEKVIEEPIVKEIVKQEELKQELKVTFTITGTKEQIIEVREFMKVKGIRYE